MVTDVDDTTVLLPLSVMFPKNSASAAVIMYFPVLFSTCAGAWIISPLVSTMVRYWFIPFGSLRPPTEMFPVATRLMSGAVNWITFEVVFPTLDTCSKVWIFVRRSEGTIFFMSLLASLTYT